MNAGPAERGAPFEWQLALRQWLACEPTMGCACHSDSSELWRYVRAGETLLAGLPAKRQRTADQQGIAAGVHQSCRNVRGRFMQAHAGLVYDTLIQDRSAHQSLADLAFTAAERFPGLVPTREQIEQERTCLQADKEGREIDQGIFFAGLLSAAPVGLRLVESMLRPTARAQQLLPAFRCEGRVDLGCLRIERRGSTAYLTVCNELCLNAEDDSLIDDMETAVDLALLDDHVRVGVLRGGPVSHPRYSGLRVFSAGINLKHLHRGQISFVNFLLRRELGYINKILRGLSVNEPEVHWCPGKVQKPWLAAVDAFAIGGGAQLLLVFDRVIAASDSYFSLPAAQEGIIPGVANLRLGRMAGGRMARQIILGGRKILAHEPEARLFFDEVVDPAQMDSAIEAGAAELDSLAVIANRRMLTLLEEPIDDFREYMAQFALEQAERLYSPDVLNKISKFAGA